MVQHRWAVGAGTSVYNQYIFATDVAGTCAGTVQKSPGKFFQPSLPVEHFSISVSKGLSIQITHS